MWLMVVLSFFLTTAHPAVREQVELFDTDKERVVQTIANSDGFQQAAQEILHSVTGRVMEMNPSLVHAMIVKIPLSPTQRISLPSEKINETIAQVFVVLPKHEQRKPWLILHTKNGVTLVLEFAAEVKKLKQLAQL